MANRVEKAAHDQSRFADGARQLRLWRDLGGSDVAREDQGVDNEWHNPVLLHGKLAVVWLECDLDVDRIIGKARRPRLTKAMGAHIVGAVDLDKGIEAAFVRLVHLADTVSTRPDDRDFQEVWDVAFTHGGLETTYGAGVRTASQATA